MITAADNNDLVDILEPDPRHGAASGDALARCLAEGTVIACDVVWAEVATVYGEKQAELLAALETLGIDYSEVTQEAALISGNTAKIIEYLGRAREAGADLVAFPELAITGYPPEDLLFKPSFLNDNLAAMEEVAAASRGIAVLVGYVGVEPDISNAAALAYDGSLVDTYRKMYLPNYGVFDEDRYFRKGDTCPVYVINGVRVGVGSATTPPVGTSSTTRKSAY